VLDRFAYLKYGLGLVLAFIGAKMIVAEGVFGFEHHIETSISLAIVAGLISVSMVASLFAPAPTQHLVDDGKESSMIAEMEDGAAIEHTRQTTLENLDEADDQK
jgi:predicted tellurium resistance membrane protein TerC